MGSSTGIRHGPDRMGPWRRIGSTLLRFAGEERRLDSEATYQAWAEAGSSCWVDTEQQPRSPPLRGMPEGARPVMADGAVVHAVAAAESAEDSSVLPTGWGEALSEFHSEIDHWRQRREAASVARSGTPVPAARAPVRRRPR